MHRYIGLDGRAVEPALKYFPEGAAKTELDQEGEFPQNGHRVPMFGEPVEVGTSKFLKRPRSGLYVPLCGPVTPGTSSGYQGGTCPHQLYSRDCVSGFASPQ